MNTPQSKETVAAEIAAERKRQIETEGYDASHDDDHKNGEIALAAACYATPVLLYRLNSYAMSVEFADPWPWQDGDRRPYNGNAVQPNSHLQPALRRQQLIKAGALIIAEIERMDRKRQHVK